MDTEDEGEGRRGGTRGPGSGPEAPETEPTGEGAPPDGTDQFPVVAIGASAGGLEDLEDLFGSCPPEPGIAFMVMTHLAAEAPSALAEVLAQSAPIEVVEAADGVPVEPDTIYVAPAGVRMQLRNGRLAITAVGSGVHPPNVIDEMMESVARERGINAVGVVLSGNLSDGTQGVEHVLAAGGLTFARNPETTTFSSMPSGAVRHGVVDFVLEPPEILPRIIDLIGPRRPDRAGFGWTAGAPSWSDTELEPLFRIVERHTHTDVRDFKRSTLRRRIQRRVVATRSADLAAYIDLLSTRSDEVDALFKDLLIKVTRFFRDTESFEVLTTEVLPELLETAREHGGRLRAWVPGCATGEEAYSLAMVIEEVVDEAGIDLDYTIFATDLSADAVEAARSGTYPHGIEGDVGPERLQRFFERTPDGYRVRDGLRSNCVFALQDLGRDPPLSNMDLVSCQNVLIYLQPPLQDRVIALFHYALSTNGFLVLGRSESLGRNSDLFKSIDGAPSIFRRRPQPDAARPHVFGPQASYPRVLPTPSRRGRSAGEGAARRFVTKRGVETREQASLLVGPTLEVLECFGDVSPFIARDAADRRQDVTKAAAPSLAPVLRQAFSETKRTGRPARRRFLPKQGEDLPSVTIEVRPIGPDKASERHFLVVLSEVSDVVPPPGLVPTVDPPAVALGPVARALSALLPVPPEAKARIAALESSVEGLRASLQTLVQENETAMEELRSANEEALSTNEEIVSTNEELQSTNEELETAKEELEASNEELRSLNTELTQRAEQISAAHDDLNNLLKSARVPILMVDSEKRIRRFTPAAADRLGLIRADEGRPLNNINLGLRFESDADIDTLIDQVLDSMGPQSLEALDDEGRWNLVEVRPYQRSDGRLDGAVVAVMDIDQERMTRAALESAQNGLRAVVGSLDTPVVVVDAEDRVRMANRAFHDLLEIPASTAEGQHLHELAEGELAGGGLKRLLDGLRGRNKTVRHVRVELGGTEGGGRVLEVNATSIAGHDPDASFVVVSFGAADGPGREEE